jgi:non-homologous end joining protein Ku
MARNATLVWGDVIIPVSLDNVMQERKGKVSFKTLHATDLSPIKQLKFCIECGEEVTKENQISGFEVSKGHLVTVTEEEKASTKAPGASILTITKWIDPIDPLWYDTSYWLTPSEMFAANYNDLAEAAFQMGLQGFGSSKVWGEHPFIVRSDFGALILTMLHSQPEFNLAARPLPGADVRDRNVQHLSEEMAFWNKPLDETDLLVTEDVLMKSLIQSKVDGSEFVAPEEIEIPVPTLDLEDAVKRMREQRMATKKRKVAA